MPLPMLTIMNFVGFFYASVAGILLPVLIAVTLLLLFRRRLKGFIFPMILLLVLPLVLVVGCYIYYSNSDVYTHRYRITLEVDTPDGVRTGSSVIQVSLRKKASGGQLSLEFLRADVRGEAVYVDLGKGKNLLALLAFGPSGSCANRLPVLAAAALGRYQTGFYRAAPFWTGQAELYGEFLPTLVTFTNPGDPDSVRVVLPGTLAAVLGPGYRFRRAWLEMTHDGPTSGILEKKLPWIGDPEEEEIAEHRLDAGHQNPFDQRIPVGVRFVRDH
ncbi:hypothetical protein dsx2_0039 [Desulfovibrio sp. X2]|uniref:hypothetical protein n=1 Tax=Desulfovibrio sp. X2 TaxID=941449 RepID=UPI00035881A3|nr:hypothetical protein [Desulfovibrio sp. X2]EPR43815.1 hypothetical protein dsx2_0039 [Desulfovibrio sp. X2]